MMKIIVSDEKGRVMAWALVIMALGALLLPPLLSHVSANLLASQAIEQGLKEQYSADSGVEYAMLQIQEGITTSQAPYTYTINNKCVDVTWGEYISQTYKITSTATSQIDGSSTTIESYISLTILDFSWLFDSAITSPGDVAIKSGSTVVGGVRCYEEKLDNKGTIDSWEPYDPEWLWPTAEQLSAFYWWGVEDYPYPGSTIDISDGTEADPHLVGPSFYDGNLTITGNGAVRLEGTVYVRGDLTVNPTPDCTVDLNGQTIYVEGNIDFQPGSTLSGSGCIIGEEDVNFQPNIDSVAGDFIFIMSTGGTSTVKPGDSLYGVVAGSANVELQPNCTLELTTPPEYLNFPDGTSGIVQIHTYNVYP